ncbi:hypothetical protein H072_8755 [Dactylellina haptotyla CBS 200.50]|uniref:Protein kinase domain-containing protein n=1 Tax=Dactylellina haptotyla (strain CBS 200.50) TaxID=1284197 RepID=S8BQM3_DACHA|nr:hypothetical protein H072_8755 [Dactylellina haptotyla CBS 200.50]
MASDYEINLLYEKSHTTPDEPTPTSVLSRLELWFSNSASATPQHIYLSLHRDDNGDATSPSDNVLDRWLSAEHECVVALTPLLHSQLLLVFKQDPASKLPSHSRFGFSLTGDRFSDPFPPPTISHTAIISDPQLPKIHYSSLKFLEAREIRPNIRIAKSPPSPGSDAPQTKCLYKAVDFSREALSLSFEVTNYKRLVAKGPDVEQWLVRLVGLVYIHDIEDSDDAVKEPQVAAADSAIEDELDETNTQFIGALFVYHPQRDLTTHVYHSVIPEEIKICWLRQLVHAIAALEEAGFEHWDLKCENVVLDTADGLPDEIYTNHIAASQEIADARITIERNRIERRSSTTTKPSPINPGKIKIIDLENSKSSAAFRPASTAGQWQAINDPSKRRESVDQHPELGISMVYAMGKTILEIWTGKMPDVGEPTEKDLAVLPASARKLVEICCLSPTRISAVQAKQIVDDLFAHYHEDDEMVH